MKIYIKITYKYGDMVAPRNKIENIRENSKEEKPVISQRENNQR